MKHISRNKVFLCFRPVMDMEAVLESEPGNGIYSPPYERISFSNAHTESKIEAQAFPASQVSTYSAESEIGRPTKRSLTRVVKAIFSLAVLRKRGNQQEYSRSKRSSAMDSEGKPFIVLSSSSTTPTQPKAHTKTQIDFGTKRRKFKMGCMAMISLGITVCWGRFCAIFFTSVWLYLIPLIEDKLAQAETKKERKSVIMKDDSRKGRH